MQFKEIKFKNFLSYPNTFTTIKLDNNQTNIIMGENGSGKSTGIVDAIYFALTGKSFRGVNLPQIVNNKNRKNCLVSLHVSNNGIEYKINRGTAPSVFEVFVNNELINDEIDFQAYIEKALNFNPKMLRFTLFMSSTSYTPFLKLSAGDKRMFIDDILDIDIFSKMTVLIKKKLSISKEVITDTDYNIDKVKSNLKLLSEVKESNKAEIEKSINEKQDYYNETEKDLNDAKKMIDVDSDIIIERSNINKKCNIIEKEIKNAESTLYETNTQLQTQISDIKLLLQEEYSSSKSKLNSEISKFKSKISDIEYDESQKIFKIKSSTAEKIKENNDIKFDMIKKIELKISEGNQKIEFIKKDIISLEEEIEYYNNTEVCATCKQNIDKDFKDTLIKNNEFKIKELRSNIKKIEIILVQLKSKIEQEEIEIASFKNVNEKDANEKIESEKTKNHEAIAAINSQINDVETKINELKNEFSKTLETQINEVKLKFKDDIENQKFLLSESKNKLQTKNNLLEEKDKEINELKNNITVLIERLKNIQNLINDLKNSIKEPKDSIVADEKKYKKEIEELTLKLDLENKNLVLYNKCINILSDKGIKLFIINKYIGLLNKYINEYLDILSSPYRLIFDENFKEKIILRGYDKLQYSNLSEGEKRRCDLSIIFGFIALSNNKSKLKSNILILDEVFAHGLDESGTDGIIEIINSKKRQGYSVWCITHDEKLKTKFDNNFFVEKNIFSEFKEI